MADAATNRTLNALTIDVEDYYHVSGFEGCVSRSQWDGFPSRVEDGELVSGLDQPARHRKAHLSKADESDFHGRIPYALSSSANSSRAIRKLSTAAGMPP